MTRQAIYFTDERSVSVREGPVPDPAAGEVLVRTERSAISPGTELLVYRNEVPDEMAIDETIDTLAGTFSYPLQYGYSTVGRVIEVGSSVDPAWLDERVFVFHPHESHFVATPDQLIPTDLTPGQAIFIPTVETAVNFVMDARPRIGARIAVLGQGPVGLLTTAVLGAFPLSKLVTADRYENRRELSESIGATNAVPPEDICEAVEETDITFELSGNPEALDAALSLTGTAGTVIVGSWYGEQDVSLTLGGQYHRSHIRMQSSQVSQLDPDHADRWSKDRRMAYVQSWLSDTDLSTLVTHELPVERADEAYQVLESNPNEAVQIVFTYD